MALYSHSGVSVESFVEMESDVPMRYEVDHLNEQVTLLCGQGSEYILFLGRNSLAELISLGNRALDDLDTADTLANT